MNTPQTPAAAVIDLDSVNAQLQAAEPAEVVRWAAETFGIAGREGQQHLGDSGHPGDKAVSRGDAEGDSGAASRVALRGNSGGTSGGGGLVMSTSFGVQSAVMLHLVTRVVPDIPVIFIDTGFHFQETYKFADELTQRLGLNLKVYAAEESPSWFIARYGQLWESDNPDDLNRYDQMRKVEPMARAMKDLGVTATLAGLRRQQTNHRANLRKVEGQDGRYKVAPILEWTTKDVHEYLTKKHGLPYHPLHEKGYASIGDWHSTSPITAGQDERSGRFNGLKQECGLHLPTTPQEDESRSSSGL